MARYRPYKCPGCDNVRRSDSYDPRKRNNGPCPQCGSEEIPVRPPAKVRGNTDSEKSMSGVHTDFEEKALISGGKPELGEPDREVDFGAELTEREQKFLTLYFGGELSQEKAMMLVGYRGYNKDYLGILARKLICKYELAVGDHRKIRRSMGWGEVRILESLIEAATGFKSETVKLNARIALAKCLGITKEIIDGVQGMKIIIDIQDV